MTDYRGSARSVLDGTRFLALAAIAACATMPVAAQVTEERPSARSVAADSTLVSRSRPLKFAEMSQGQAPDRLFITCSDSRLIPSQITDTGIGELFVIRNAGNIVPPFDARLEGVSATVEYAVAVLEVPTVVVCGHTRCGAMKAALDPTGLEAVPNVANWIKFVEPARLALDELHPHVGPVERWNRIVELNVLQQLANLRTHPWVAARTASGRLRLEGWVFELESHQLRLLPQP
ncbi:MAG: hypothetical protein OXN89_11515 [Bryobacterales bacterium]|nr:hypothetical protein [Bryobacterales bacterium]